jgi:hypothetical protein
MAKPNKDYSVAVWDMSFCLVDDDADDYVRNDDGSVKLFDIPQYDYSTISDYITAEQLVEREAVE